MGDELDAKEYHRRAIKALSEGKPVTRKVLNEYPDLQKEFAPTANQLLQELNEVKDKLYKYIALKERTAFGQSQEMAKTKDPGKKENPGIKATKRIKNDPELHLLFHSGTAEQNKDILAVGLQPTFGTWLEEVLVNATDDEDLAQDIRERTSVIFFSEHPDWVKIKVVKKINKSLHDTTREDIKEHGQLCILGIDPEQDEVYRADEEAQTATRLDGEDTIYELPFGVESNDIFSQEELAVDTTLIGDELLEFLDYWQDKRSK